MKTYYIQFNIGRSKYVVNFCTGENFHPDGSLFFDIEIFKNKKELNKFERELIKSGYKYAY
jgi:hypothetical protein